MYMNYNNEMNEGSIDVKNETKLVIEIIREVIEGMYRDGIMKVGMRIGLEELWNKVLKVINNKINDRVKSKGIDGVCNIVFIPLNGDGRGDRVERLGGYLNKVIYFAADWYLVNRIGVDNFIIGDRKRIRYDKMSRTLEHELVHYHQDMRSKGKFLIKSKERGLSDDELVDLMSRKKFINKKDDDEEFIEDVRYYNDEAELDTFANNVADKYVQYMMNWFVKSVRFRARDGEDMKREYSGDEVRRIVLKPIYNAKEGGDRGEYFNLRFLKSKLKELHKGYKYLTVSNRKKWWKYVIKALLNHKFEGIVI